MMIEQEFVEKFKLKIIIVVMCHVSSFIQLIIQSVHISTFNVMFNVVILMYEKRNQS